MISIDVNKSTTISKSATAKSTNGKDNNSIYSMYAKSIVNFQDTTREFSTYEMANWINNNDRWIKNRLNNNSRTFKRGIIVMLELGANNFAFEPSFAHPCIILGSDNASLLIVPCSSKKYGLGRSEIIDATIADGFSINTGIQTHNFRWVSKNRVISIRGKVTPNILDKIDQKMLELIPSYKLIVIQKNDCISQLEEEKLKLCDDLKNAEEEIKSLKEELKEALNRII